MRKKKERGAVRMLVLITQLGICMMTPIFFCVFLGQFLTQKTDIMILFPVLLVIGILAGFRSCYIMISRFVTLGKKEESDRHEMDKMDSGGK